MQQQLQQMQQQINMAANLHEQVQQLQRQGVVDIDDQGNLSASRVMSEHDSQMNQEDSQVVDPMSEAILTRAERRAMNAG